MNTPATSIPANHSVPDLVLTSAEGTALRLASLWQERPTLLFFLRHFGCALCRAALFRIRDRAAEFHQRNSSVAVIVPADALAAARFGEQYRIGFPLIADPGRKAYRAFGIGEGRLIDAVGPAVAVRQLREALHGNWPYIDLDGPSIRQLGGVVIVDQAGVVQFTHVAKPIYTYPQVDTYLHVLDTIAANTLPHRVDGA